MLEIQQGQQGLKFVPCGIHLSFFPWVVVVALVYVGLLLVAICVVAVGLHSLRDVFSTEY